MWARFWPHSLTCRWRLGKGQSLFLGTAETPQLQKKMSLKCQSFGHSWAGCSRLGKWHSWVPGLKVW